MWHRCTMELERVRQQLRAAGTDPAAIAHAAREGAGVLAAWSLALEGEQPGALARAARQLARSAELPAHTPPPPKRLSRASGLALFMLAAGKPDSAVGWRSSRARSRSSPPSLAACTAPAASSTAPSRSRPSSAPSSRRSKPGFERERPARDEDLDAEAQAAKRAREPLPPPARDPGREGAGEAEDVKRLINPLRGRKRPRGW